MENLNNYIEHTLLKQDAVKEDFIRLFNEAKENKFFGVCINPAYVALAKEHLKDTDVKIVTVVGFPLGANKTIVKSLEALTALKDGADEVDMVLNVTELKNKNYEYVKNDIMAVKAVCEDSILKVILETDLLTKGEIVKACEICAEAGANIVKTSTGFVKNGVGAKVEDVKLMHDTVEKYGMKVKASGGIKTREQAIALIEAGASRLGTSSGVQIVKG